MGGKGENCQGGGGRGGGGKVKEPLSLRPVGTLVVRERMKKTPAVQSGRAMPIGRCASPPWLQGKQLGMELTSCLLSKVIFHIQLPRKYTAFVNKCERGELSCLFGDRGQSGQSYCE